MQQQSLLVPLFQEIKKFSQESHRTGNYYQETVFVQGDHEGWFAPFSYLKKNISEASSLKVLQQSGFVINSLDLTEEEEFCQWYEFQFGNKIKISHKKNVFILSASEDHLILKAIRDVHVLFDLLKKQNILLNSKNLPTQLGEWYAKKIFGLTQRKSLSQRGFDFFLEEKRVEIKVTWGEMTSPKGIKLKKTLLQLSDFTILLFLANDFFIRELCFLDSEFLLRKFDTKGHTLFLKDRDIAPYFLSRSSFNQERVVDYNSLLKFSRPLLALKLSERTFS